VNQWIPYREGEYLVARAFLVSPDGAVEPIENPVIEIYADATGMRHLRGSGRVENVNVVSLLEDHNALDLIMDLGEDTIYRLPAPELKAGKVFTPGVRSTMQFSPTVPWYPVTPEALDDLLGKANRPETA
jgi:hypothetical protein